MTLSPTQADVVVEPWSEAKMLADLDRRRIVTLAKLGLLLSTMSGESIDFTDHGNSPDLYAEVLMALGIEDADDTDIALEIARDHPEGCLLLGERDLTSPIDVIMRIAAVSKAFAFQAGVGGMETAGSIISFLAAHPEHIDDFLSGKTSPVDWPIGWHEQGCLTWHGQDGKVHNPADVRRHRLIKQMEKGA